MMYAGAATARCLNRRRNANGKFLWKLRLAAQSRLKILPLLRDCDRGGDGGNPKRGTRSRTGIGANTGTGSEIS